MMYLDANFFVFALLDQTIKGKRARQIQKKIVLGKKAVTSVLALDEVMWVLIKNSKAHLLRQAVEDIYAMPNVEVREVASLVPMRALDIMERFGLKPRDAFHVAVMEQFNLHQIVSDDRDFDRLKNIKRLRFD